MAQYFMSNGWQILWTALAAAGTNLLFGAYLGSKIKGSVDDAFTQEKEKREESRSNRNYVTQAQFDVQLAATKELLEALADTYIALMDVAPSISIKPSNLPRLQVVGGYTERISKLDNSNNSLKTKNTALRAFIPEDIYKILSEIISLIWECSLRLNMDKDNESEAAIYQTGEPFVEKVKDLFEGATSSTRDYFAGLSVRQRADSLIRLTPNYRYPAGTAPPPPIPLFPLLRWHPHIHPKRLQIPCCNRALS